MRTTVTADTADDVQIDDAYCKVSATTGLANKGYTWTWSAGTSAAYDFAGTPTADKTGTFKFPITHNCKMFYAGFGEGVAAPTTPVDLSDVLKPYCHTKTEGTGCGEG